jgi:hypothetical protein
MLRAKPVVKGFNFTVRISDLRPAEFLLMTCRTCSAARRVAPWMLYSVAPPTLPIKSLEPRMLCQTCGRRGNMAWAIFEVEPPVRVISASEIG